MGRCPWPGCGQLAVELPKSGRKLIKRMPKEDLSLRTCACGPGGPLPAEGIGSSGADRRRARGRDV